MRVKYSRAGKVSSATLLDELIRALPAVDPLSLDVGYGPEVGTVVWADAEADAATIERVITDHDPNVFQTREDRRRQLVQQDIAVLKNRLQNTTVPWEKAAIRMIARLYGEVYDS